MKKNFNFPLKLRQPSVGDVLEGTLQDQQNNNLMATVIVENNEQPALKTRRTKLLKKSTHSEVAGHLRDITSSARHNVEGNCSNRKVGIPSTAAAHLRLDDSDKNVVATTSSQPGCSSG